MKITGKRNYLAPGWAAKAEAAAQEKASALPAPSRARNRGKARGARFSLRLPHELRAVVGRFAKLNGMSLNDAIVAVLATHPALVAFTKGASTIRASV